MPTFHKASALFRINIFIKIKLNLFKVISLGYLKMFKASTLFSYLNIKIKRVTHSREQGMLLVEVILIAVFLATVAIGTSYFFAQTKATMTSSSQVMECQTIAKQALESVVSLGTRLYGYKIKVHDTIRPLLGVSFY